jgi:hypothetical protein
VEGTRNFETGLPNLGLAEYLIARESKPILTPEEAAAGRERLAAMRKALAGG